MTFATFVMSSEDNILTPTRAFVCLTLFDMIRMPLALLPLLIVYIIEVNFHCEITRKINLWWMFIRSTFFKKNFLIIIWQVEYL